MMKVPVMAWIMIVMAVPMKPLLLAKPTVVLVYVMLWEAVAVLTV